MKKNVLIVGLGLLVSLASCSKDEESTAGYQLKFTQVSQKKNASNIQVSKAIAYLEEVSLEKEVGPDQELEFDIEGRFAVDLITGNSNPQIPKIEIEPGTYHELELEFGDEDELAIDIEASISDSSGQTYQLLMTIVNELEFEIEAEGNGLVIPEDFFVTLQVKFPITQALEAIDWSTVSVDANNAIYVNASSNSHVIPAFLAALNLEVDD